MQISRCLKAYISLRVGGTEQLVGINAGPRRNSELYPPGPPCWPDLWLSEKRDENIMKKQRQQ